MCFVHLKAYLNVTVDFAAHRGALHRGIPDLNRTAPHRSKAQNPEPPLVTVCL